MIVPFTPLPFIHHDVNSKLRSPYGPSVKLFLLIIIAIMVRLLEQDLGAIKSFLVNPKNVLLLCKNYYYLVRLYFLANSSFR